MCKRTVKTLSSLLFFLVRRVKRARDENGNGNGKSSGSSNLVPRILSPSSLHISRLAGGPWERLGFDRVCSKKEHNILLAVLVHFYNYANNYASFNKLCSF